MWEMIRIFLFANAVWLTPNPVDFTPASAKTFSGTEISAINSGARLHVDVTEMMPREAMTNISIAREWVQKNIPEGSVAAELQCPKCNGDVELTFKGHTSWDKNSMSISLEGSEEIPTGKEFTEVRINSMVPLRQVRVQWINYSK
ncbi:MAG: hypothetical protein QM761_03395 [Pseudoxanthomonas sp.]